MGYQKRNFKKLFFLQLVLFFDADAHPMPHDNKHIPNNLLVQTTVSTQLEQPKKNELISTSSRPSDTTPPKLIHELRINGQLEVARDLAISYLKNHPHDVDVILELGLIYYQQKNYEQAEIYLNSALTKTPTYFDARVGLINTMIAEKKYQNALDLIQSGLKQNQDNKQLLELKSRVLSAEQNTQQVRETKPSFIPSIMPSILVEIQQLRKNGQIDAAKDKAMDYLQLHPDDLDIMVQVGLIALQQKNYHQAEFYLSSVLAKAPNYLDARIGLIATKMDEKKYPEALNLIHEGLIKNPHDTQLKLLEVAVEQAQQSLQDTEKEKNKSSLMIADLKKLRQQGKANLAQDKAIHYLKDHPDDIDVLLELGLIYFQQKEFTKAENELNFVLEKTPTYVDARVGLIKINMIKHNYKKAMNLLNEGLKITPHDVQLVQLKKEISSPERVKNKHLTQEELDLLQARKMMSDKKYEQAKQIYSFLLLKNRNNVDALIGLADYYLAKTRDYAALHLIQKELVHHPNNIKLLIKVGEIQTLFRRYGLASKAYQKALTLEPQNKDAQAHLNEIKDISPRFTYGINEIGLSSDNTYVSDLHKNWDYSSVYYARETNVGMIMAKVNYASRFGVKAPQYELDFSPQLNRNVHIDLVAAYADQPVLFPKYVVGGEGYALITNSIEISAGDRYSNIGPTYFSTYTGSISLYPNHYWISFRPYYFVPKDTTKEALLYTGIIRRYFSTIDHYLSLGLGTGKSPDLADLLTVNFIVIKNTFVNLTYEFPIMNHHLVMDLSAGYQRWNYPSGLLRELYDGNIGIKYRF